MKRQTVFLICVVGLVVSLACVRSVTAELSGDVGPEPAGKSTGDAYILNGDGCPDGYTYVRSGESYGGCTFEADNFNLEVYCNGEYNREFLRYECGPVWRSDDEPLERGLEVFWPGGHFACVKERCFDCK